MKICMGQRLGIRELKQEGMAEREGFEPSVPL